MCTTMLAWPTESEVVTGPFGEPRGDHNHQGLDIRARNGRPAFSSYFGTVTRAGRVTRGGYGVFVTSPGGYSTRSEDLGSNLAVHVGQLVSPGDVLGYSAPNPNESGPHLHFELRASNGAPVNPAMCIDIPAAPSNVG